MVVSVGDWRCSTHLADSAIQQLTQSAEPCGVVMPAAGPQNPGKGNSPKSRFISVRMEAGWVYISNTLRPSAGYIGRGVRLQSALEYMLYHQNTLANVKSAWRSRRVSHTFGPCTS